ncbi:hypothetical protein BDR03DRAFT_949705 [Suillus americanus]|nr:hypothetical protein BDR03DRAFT_949705 [Suillus americanus]
MHYERYATPHMSHLCDACDLRQKCDIKLPIVSADYTEKNCSREVCLALSSSSRRS